MCRSFPSYSCFRWRILSRVYASRMDRLSSISFELDSASQACKADSRRRSQRALLAAGFHHVSFVQGGAARTVNNYPLSWRRIHMLQCQLELELCRITGESLSVIRNRGFSLV